MEIVKPVILFSFVISLSILVMMLSGCASAPATEKAHAGFLSRYDKLKPVEGDDSTLKFRKGNLDQSLYRNIVIQSPQVLVSEVMENSSTLPLHEQEALGQYFATKLEQKLGDEIALQDKGRTIYLRGAFNGITYDPVKLESYQYIPIALIATGVKEAGGKRDKVPVMFVEFEAVDGVSGEILAQVVRRIDLPQVDPDTLDKQGMDAIKQRIDKEILRVGKDIYLAKHRFQSTLVD